jgi:hypothetical protein
MKVLRIYWMNSTLMSSLELKNLSITRRQQLWVHLWPITRCFKYDWDKLWLVYTLIVPVIFEPPCITIIINHQLLFLRLWHWRFILNLLKNPSFLPCWSTYRCLFNLTQYMNTCYNKSNFSEIPVQWHLDPLLLKWLKKTNDKCWKTSCRKRIKCVQNMRKQTKLHSVLRPTKI